MISSGEYLSRLNPLKKKIKAIIILNCTGMKISECFSLLTFQEEYSGNINQLNLLDEDIFSVFKFFTYV